jgi:predicted DNA-binding protein YlxM (UPF0122 family)
MLCVGKDVDGGNPFRSYGQKGKGEKKRGGSLDDGLRLDRRVYVNALYDFYAPLLTQRQRDVYEMRRFSDLSLTEIAETLEITRQAVHILVNRTEERLLALEKDLGFAAQM